MVFKNPYYQIYISNSSCIFEIRVNDMHAVYFNYPGTVAFDQPINHLLLRSGKQRLTIRMLPVAGQSMLNELSRLEIKVQVMEATGDFSVRQEVIAYTTPAVNEHTPALEHKLDFDAQFPYVLAGWQHSASLKNEPGIKEQLFAWYKMMHEVIATKDMEAFKKLNAKAYEEDSISIYNSAFMDEHLAEVFGYLADPDYRLVPLDIDALQLHYFGDGKVVSLLWPDRRPAIYLEFPKDKSQYTLDFFLHRPASGNGWEVIR